MSLNPLAIHLHLRILLNLIIVKLPDSLREQLKIPLGILLPIGQDNKENIQNHLLVNSCEEWDDYQIIVCNSINVNNVKKLKLIKRGYKSILKQPEIFFNKEIFNTTI